MEYGAEYKCHHSKQHAHAIQAERKERWTSTLLQRYNLSERRVVRRAHLSHGEGRQCFLRLSAIAPTALLFFLHRGVRVSPSKSLQTPTRSRLKDILLAWI